MVLDFEYGVNTGNRFLDFVDHDEDPEEFIARQTQNEEKQKKSTKDTKPVTSATTKKTTSKTTTTTTSTTNVSSNTTKTNKENLTGKSTNTDQRKQQSAVFSDNNNQQTRPDSGRGGGRGFSRRGGSAGQDRPAYEGGNRGGGQQRSQRFNKFEGQPRTNETSGFEQGGEAWGNETPGNENQSFSGYRGRGRGGPRRGNFEGGRGNFEGGRGNFEGGRGNYEGGRGNYEGGRGRGRGRGGRGNFNNRNFEEGSQQQQQQQQQQQPPQQEGNEWQQNTEQNFDNTRSQPARTGGGQELDADVSPQERSFEPDNNRRGGRGSYRARTFHNNRNYGGDRPSHYEREGGEGGQEDYRHNRRQYDRQPRTNLSGVKPIEKKDGEGAHNWGNQTENPEDHPVSEEITETTGQIAPASKDWAQQVDEAEKQMTLDEYKKQLEAKKKANQEKLPQFKTRTAGEGEDPKVWKEPEHVYQKKNDEDETEEGDDESGAEESGSGEEEIEEEQISGKKKVISIPLRFKPIEVPRGPAGSYSSRGGPRRGSGTGRYQDRPNRDEQPIANSPNQQQAVSSQQPADYQNDEQQPAQPQQQQPQQQQFYRGGQRGGSRQGSGRGEYRRSYGNSTRGSRGSYNRSSVDPNAPDIDNRLDFPTLPKQSNV